MVNRDVSALLIGHEHHIRGSILTDGRRLLEILNAKTTDYLEVNNARVFRRDAAEECIAKLSTVVVTKVSISLIVVIEEKHEAPERRLHAFTPKVRYPVFLTLPGHEVAGKIHLTYAPDAKAVLARDTDDFFPLTDAVVARANSVGSLKANVVMVNKAHLGLFYINPSPVTT